MVASESPINGYIMARAPKGNVEANYFPRGNGPWIDALMGVGSAHWPDLLEAKAFNDEYPIYISAPPGTSEAYPSYLGGFYITKSGVYKFHNITDKYELQDNIGNAYKVKVQPGREELFNGDFASRKSQIIIQGPELEDYIPDASEVGYGVFEFRKDDNSAIIITKDRRLNVTDIDYDTMENGLVSPVGTQKIYWGDNDNEAGWEFSGQSATLKDFGFVYGVGDERNPLRDFIGQTNYDAIVLESNMGGLMQLFVNGFYAEDDITYSIAFPLQDNISFLVTLREETYAYVMQKSPTEIPTSIKISMIGYDKYRYDKLFAYAVYDPAQWSNNKLRIKAPSGMTTSEQAALLKAMEDNEFVVFYDTANPTNIFRIGQYVSADESDDNAPYYTDVTGNYITQYITCDTALDGIVNNEIYHKIFYVESATEFKHLLTEEENIDLYGQDGPNAYILGMVNGDSAPKNPNFNALTISCSEEVYVGSTMSGGSFTGSLDEYGVDTFGGNIYFPTILPDDALSFIEIRILKKFGDDSDDLDATGFWNHKRIIDPYDQDKDGTISTEKAFTIEGDRFVSMLVTMNQLEQRTGGIYGNQIIEAGFDSIIKASIEEGKLAKYDDVMIYMEPTGRETYKADLAALSKANELAAVISPKILTPDNRGIFTDLLAQKVIVSGRVSLSSNAQYAGEFEVLDSISKKKYWCQPIGDIGCNIARIIEKKYGGWAPAWTNISGDLGGQLKRAVIRSKYAIDDDANKTLDSKGVNPIIYTSDEGLMITSQKTTQDPNNVSDWTFLGHSLSFQSLKREIRDNVMRPQIMKPINEYWMSMRQTQTENILAKRTGGSSPIWAIGLCDIFGQNTPTTKAARNFVIKVDVKVNVFSETVTLIVDNHEQSWNG